MALWELLKFHLVYALMSKLQLVLVATNTLGQCFSVTNKNVKLHERNIDSKRSLITLIAVPVYYFG